MTETPAKSKLRTVKICTSCGKPVGNQGVSSLTSWLFQETFCQCQLKESPGVKQSAPTPAGSLFGTGPGAKDTFDLPDLGGEYEVLERIGKGGMGSVYKVRDKELDRFLAVKVLHDELKDDQQSVSRFEREAKAALKLMHANLVPVFSYGTSRVGSPYLVMDFVDGESLETRLKNDSYLEVTAAIDIFIQICDALTHAHQHGIIHRDIKPGNIIITRSADGKDIAKLVDFGIAKVRSGSGRETQNLTQTGEVFGSPHYMSPEQCLGFDLDSRSDIYSLGCVMYECLSGKSPFDGHNAVQLIAKHLSSDAPPLRICDVAQGDKVNERLAAIIYRCLEKDPQNRYFSVELLANELRQLTNQVSEKGGLVLPRKLSIVRSLFAICCIASVASIALFSVPIRLTAVLLFPVAAAIIGAFLLNDQLRDFVSRTQFQSRLVKNLAGPCVDLLVLCHWLLALCAGLALATPLSPFQNAAYPVIAAGLGTIIMLIVWTGFQLDSESSDIQGGVTTGKVMSLMSVVLIFMLIFIVNQCFSPSPTDTARRVELVGNRNGTNLSIGTMISDSAENPYIRRGLKDLPNEIFTAEGGKLLTTEAINGLRYKVFHFPDGVDLGTIKAYSPTGNTSFRARGTVRVRADAKLCLRLTANAVQNYGLLLKRFGPADFQGLEVDGKYGAMSSIENTDDLMYYISRWKKLKQLMVSDTDLSDDGLRHIAQLTELRDLVLSRTLVTGKAVAALPQLRSLKSLDIASLTNANLTLKALNRSAQLFTIDVSGTDLNKVEVLQLAQFPNLRSLRIENCAAVSDDFIKNLAARNQLLYLNISGCRVSDKALAAISKFQSLRILIISSGTWSKEKIDQLQKSFPNLSIEYRAPLPVRD
ncbi:MAG: hypothetical protein C0507_24200 [Cyanobacteria bacterium PR.3.49]|nr:hypothetical protein [Cyanobacteria bacterium PR.3.49]